MKPKYRKICDYYGLNVKGAIKLYGDMRTLMAEIEFSVPMETFLDTKYKKKENKRNEMLNEIFQKMLVKD